MSRSVVVLLSDCIGDESHPDPAKDTDLIDWAVRWSLAIEDAVVKAVPDTGMGE